MPDNGPKFSSTGYAGFTTRQNFNYTTINGWAETSVKEGKQLLNRYANAREHVHLVLMEHKNTSSLEMDVSPAYRLFGRRTNT